MTIKLWPFRPDWEGGVLEKLEWLTDVMASTKGAEQRRPQRLTPRKTMEVTFLPHDRERSVFDLYVMKKGNDDWYVPLWYDVGLLNAAVAIDATVIPTEVSYREFTLNGLAVIRVRPTADFESTTFTYEIVKVVGRSTGSLSVVRAQEGTTAVAWGAGSEIYPLRKARFTNQPQAKIVTASVHSAQMSFSITEPNEWQGSGQQSGYGGAYSQAWAVTTDVTSLTPAANLGRVFEPAAMPLFEGLRVLTYRPDYNQDLTLSYDRVLSELDNGNGIPRSTDTLGFGVPTHNVTWFLTGRQEAAGLRTLLYWLRGKVRPLWVPTFNADLQLIAPAPLGQFYIDIEPVGYGELGGIINRQVLAINLVDDSWIFRRIVGSAEGDGYERLELSEALPRAVTLNDVYKISFMGVCRLAQDTVEINHVTDTVGLTKLSTTFRASPDLRQYLPWSARLPSSPQSCPKTCEGMQRVADFPGYGMPDFSWSLESVLLSAKGAYMHYKLVYSQTWVPWYDTEITDNDTYRDFDLLNRNYWEDHSGNVYDAAADSAFYDAKIASILGETRAAGETWIDSNVPTRVEIAAALADGASFQDFYLKLRAMHDYNFYTASAEQTLACHPRRWLPMAKLASVNPTCDGGMLGAFCTQSMWSVEPLGSQPQQARGASTLYAAGVVERLIGVDPVEWPNALDSGQGIIYRYSAAPLVTNGVFYNCGCIPLQFEENHTRLHPNDAPTIDADPSWAQWRHYAQMSLLTPAAWPTEVRVIVYDAMSNIVLRTLDLTIENFEVTSKADEYHCLATDDDFTANLVVFREVYGAEPDGQTTHHADPWEGIWNLIPVAVDGIKVEIYAR